MVSPHGPSFVIAICSHFCLHEQVPMLFGGQADKDYCFFASSPYQKICSRLLEILHSKFN